MEFLEKEVNGTFLVYYLPIRSFLGKCQIGLHEESEEREELDPVYLKEENVEEMLLLFPGFLAVLVLLGVGI